MKTSPNPTIEISLPLVQHRFRFKQLAPTVGHGEVSSKKIGLGVRLTVWSSPFALSRSLDTHGTLSRGYSTRFVLSRVIVTVRSLAITRHSSFLSRLLSTVRSLAVTRHHSLSRSYSTPFALSRLLGTVHSLAITRYGSLSRSYSTPFALSRLLDTVRSLAVTRHDSLSRGYSALLDLSRLLGTVCSLAFTRITLSRSHSARSLAVTRDRGSTTTRLRVLRLLGCGGEDSSRFPLQLFVDHNFELREDAQVEAFGRHMAQFLAESSSHCHVTEARFWYDFVSLILIEFGLLPSYLR
ncbi:hypothetical protein Rs2_44075 [Raphanus sativus]|nr:hypothetical protein Rs2_44075 [Raphanus sativus]